MSHNHNHSCVCEHTNIKYCKHCQKPYCLDCNKDWGTISYWPYQYPYTTIQPYWYNTAGGNYRTSGYIQTTSSRSQGSQAQVAASAQCNHQS